MLRKLVLGLGLVLELAGVILTLIVMKAVGSLLSGDWPPINWFNLPMLAHLSPSEFFGWFLFPTAFLLVLGFLFLSVGMLYPKQSAERMSESEENKA
jgi:hypothetical protein